MGGAGRIHRTGMAALALAAALALSACEGWPRVLHPIVSEKEQASAPELLGEWQIPEESELLRFEEHKGQRRLLEFRPASPNGDDTENHEEEIKAVYEYRVLRVGRYLVLELTEQSSRDESISAPAHLLLRIEIFGDSMDLRLLSGKWVREGLEQGRLDLAHENLEDGSLLITASTKELQKFLSSNAWDDMAFPQEGATYQRRSPAPRK